MGIPHGTSTHEPTSFDAQLASRTLHPGSRHTQLTSSRL